MTCAQPFLRHTRQVLHGTTRRPGRPSRRDEKGQVSVLIIGFAAILLLAIAVVVDSSAAYLQRQGLDTLADGAALQGADLGAVGTYHEGVPEHRLMPERSQVHRAVADYLVSVGAHDRYPGLSHSVQVDQTARVVRVTLRAPLDLPMKVPGLHRDPSVAATGSAAVTVQLAP